MENNYVFFNFDLFKITYMCWQTEIPSQNYHLKCLTLSKLDIFKHIIAHLFCACFCQSRNLFDKETLKRRKKGLERPSTLLSHTWPGPYHILHFLCTGTLFGSAELPASLSHPFAALDKMWLSEKAPCLPHTWTSPHWRWREIPASSQMNCSS